MYTSFFELKEAPFSLTPDPRYLYLSSGHIEAINHLLYGINERKGFILVTGEIGAGKTTICRVLLDRLDKDTKSALILNSFISDIELLKMIALEFGIETGYDTGSKKDYIDALNRFLLDNFSSGRNAVLLIDEAQNLSDNVLEQLRMLSNLETEREKLLQIVLIGQPELEGIIASPSLKQLNERIAVRYHLGPLKPQDIKGYVEHRLIIAGGHGNIRFSKSAFKKIYSFSKGIPRRINSLCDRALLIAYTGELRFITGNIIEKSGKDLYGIRVKKGFAFNRPELRFTLSLIFVLLLIMTVLFTGVISPDYIRTVFRDDKTAAGTVSGKAEEKETEAAEQDVIDSPYVFLTEKEGISTLFSLFDKTAAPEGKLTVHTQMSLVTYRLEPEYHVRLKRPFMVSSRQPDGQENFILIIKSSRQGALCLDKSGREIEVDKDFLYENWGGIVSWVYPSEDGMSFLSKGVSDPDVSRIQGILQEIGYIVNLTGTYDEETFDVVKKFQKDFGLIPDGISGPRTRALLYQMAG